MESVKNILESELQALQADIVRNIEQAGSVITRRTQQAFSIDASDTSGSLQLNTDDFVTDSKAESRAFIQALRDYVTSKNITIKNDEQLDRLARFIKWRIENLDGGTPNGDVYQQPVEAFVQRAELKIADAYIEKINEML